MGSDVLRGPVQRIETQLSQSRVELNSSSEAGSPRQPEGETVARGGGMGGGAAPIVLSRCVATPSLVVR
jgi:hypothetical protein